MLDDSRDLSQLLPEDDSNLSIPSQLVTMKRSDGSSDEHSFAFATRHIAEIVAKVQEGHEWKGSWATLKTYYRDPETRVAAGLRFERMFLRILEDQGFQCLSPCYELDKSPGRHPRSPSVENTAVMPWTNLHEKAEEANVDYISIGNDNDGVPYSDDELMTVINKIVGRDPPQFRILVPVAKNWPTWDAAIVLSAKEGETNAIHVIFLQTTTDSTHAIVAKGLNAIRNVAPAGHSIHYHYVLVLLTDDSEPTVQIPKWRDVKLSSKGQKDPTWTLDNLKQYVMFVPMKELLKSRSQGVTSKLPSPLSLPT
jgi:hypothetical protein